MKCTKEKPTEPGWYWKSDEDSPWRRRPLPLMKNGVIRLEGGEWWLHVPEPEEKLET